MNLSIAHCSDRGGREVNQDYVGFCADERIGCFALADGTGGYDGGEVASRAVVSEILRHFQQSPMTRCGDAAWTIDTARKALDDARDRHPDCHDMNTTLAALVVDAENALASWCHLGDSRIYLFRKGRARMLTHDHSVLQALMDAGLARGPVRAQRERNTLYAAVGSNEIPPTALCSEPLALMPGDVFLLCSDGFWDIVDEQAMEETLDEATLPEDWIQCMWDRISGKVDSDSDNFSAVAVWVGPRIEVTRILKVSSADGPGLG